jgi:hypothetical protein
MLVPYAAQYVREATSLGMAQLVKKIFIGSVGFRGLLSALQLKPVNFITLFLESELKNYFDVLPKNRVKGVFLHEVLTELIMSFNLGDVIREIAKHFHKMSLDFGLETRNIRHLMHFLKNNRVLIDYLMTPLNPLGYQMTPSKEEAERSIYQLSGLGIKIIAINVLASGAIMPKQAITYLSRFNKSLFAIAVGTSKSWRAFELFQQFSALKNH